MWEYRQVDAFNWDVNAVLNSHAREGWELMQNVFEWGFIYYTYHLTFRRLKPC